MVYTRKQITDTIAEIKGDLKSAAQGFYEASIHGDWSERQLFDYRHYILQTGAYYRAWLKALADFDHQTALEAEATRIASAVTAELYDPGETVAILSRRRIESVLEDILIRQVLAEARPPDAAPGEEA